MDTKELWQIVDRHSFMLKLIELIVVFPHIPAVAEEYAIGQDKCSGLLKLRKGRYEWEFSDVGAFRFRDIECGPWSQWRSTERA